MSRRRDRRPWTERPATVVVAFALTGAVSTALCLTGRLAPGAATALHLAGMSALAFGLFALDKARASRGGRRVAETCLLLAAALGGALGAVAGMRAWRHKTRHARFRLLLPLLALLQVAFLAGVVAAASGRV